jgi:hypothetical protein
LYAHCGAAHQAAFHATPPAGGPGANATFFCDGTSTFCYSLITAAISQPDAKARCNRMGGQLAAWADGVRQLDVERCVSSSRQQAAAAAAAGNH